MCTNVANFLSLVKIYHHLVFKYGQMSLYKASRNIADRDRTLLRRKENTVL